MHKQPFTVHSAPKTDHERGKKGMFTEHVRRGKTDSVDVKMLSQGCA